MVEKSIILIDAENIFQSWKNYCNGHNLEDKIDYKKLVNEISKETSLLRSYFYDGVQTIIPPQKKKFFDSLRMQGFEVKTKIVKERSFQCSFCQAKSKKFVQKGVDVSLSTDIIRHSLQLSTNICIVVSGDEDFLDAITFVKDRGTKVWVASFKHSLSRELRLSADKFISIEDIFHKIKR